MLIENEQATAASIKSKLEELHNQKVYHHRTISDSSRLERSQFTELDQNLIENIVEGLNESKVTFLVGAGISANRPSYVPTWGELVNEILDYIAGPDRKDEVNYVMNNNELLLNEVIFKIISDVLGVHDTVALLKSSIDNDSFNLTHKQLAYLSAEYGAGIITPNFDELIEKAHQSLKIDKPVNIVKVHGTISSLDLARFTVDNIFKPLSDEVSEKVKSNLSGKLLVVMGYRGADTFDLIPLLIDKESRPDKIIWFTRNKNRAEIKNNKELFKGNIILFEGNFGDYLENICNSQLAESKLDISPYWWKENIYLFFINLSLEKLSLLPFLWARILEHIKAYNIYENDNKNINSYAVLNAFESYVEINEDTPLSYNCLYSEAHLLYAKRITGMNISDDFSEVIAKIETSLLKEYNSHELQRLLGWTYHQFAVSLQSTNDNYFQAKLMLLHACNIRSKLNDPEYVFSLFQLFMNAYHASNKNNWEIDDLAPIGWRKWMVHEMEARSKILERNYKYDLYSTNLHNLGFLYQYLASERSTASEVNEEYLHSAIKCYKEALKIRMHLRDMRLVAQSIVRLSQSYLLLAKCENHDIKEYYSEIKDYIENVEIIYKRIPQEDFRYDDLEQLKKELGL